MRIALLQCTSRKKAYKCPAREMYSESPRFRQAYALAKLVADRILILSAKYGLVPEDMAIEPYNETLKDKSAQERRAWGDMVLNELRRVSDLERDEFIVLVGKVYHGNLLPHLVHFWLPLKGKRQGEWIPELERLITIEKESDKAMFLHMLFNGLPRLDWTMINQIPYQNGIIASLNRHPSFDPSSNWLGLNSPISEIVTSGLWNRQGLRGQPLSDDELEQVKWLARFGNDSYSNSKGHKARVQRTGKQNKTIGEPADSAKTTADDIRQYIEKLLQEAKMIGKTHIDLISGDIHKQMGMKNRMPEVCKIMYEKMMTGDEVLHTIPSGKSSTIKIRYYLRNR